MMEIEKLMTKTLLLLLLNKVSFDEIYQLGDSINDTGNLYLAGNTTFCSNYPYGISLSHHSGIQPRCSDGLVLIDFIAKSFNLTINPYLDKIADFKQGVNFAVAGATALDSSSLSEKHIFLPYTNKSLSIQLTWFRSHLKSICSGTLECKEKLKRALIIMGEIGGNDYNYALIMKKSQEELYQLVPEVIAAIKNATKELIKLGGRTMVLAGNFPMGCLPIYLSQFQTNDSTKYDDLNCLKEWNDFARFHNDRLQEAIKELQQEHPHVTIVYADYFSALIWVIENAESLGSKKDSQFRFTVLTKNCKTSKRKLTILLKGVEKNEVVRSQKCFGSKYKFRVSDFYSLCSRMWRVCLSFWGSRLLVECRGLYSCGGV